jgi:beta-alanine degradation protein BauB
LADPTQTDPDKYRVVFENERVRVLEYRDELGQRTSAHDHPDSVMVTMSSFDRRLIAEGGETRDVTLERGVVRWLDAQTHSGENIGTTRTHVLFVELKEPTEREGAGRLGSIAGSIRGPLGLQSVVMGRAGIEPATLGLRVPCSTS